jgi:hypothetical protein
MQRSKMWFKVMETWNYFLNFQESNVSMRLMKIVEKKAWLTLPKHRLLSLLKYSLLPLRLLDQQ